MQCIRTVADSYRKGYAAIFRKLALKSRHFLTKDEITPIQDLGNRDIDLLRD